MKLWEITHVIDKVTMVERVEADTKMEARSVIVQRYKQQINFKSVKEIAA